MRIEEMPGGRPSKRKYLCDKKGHHNSFNMRIVVSLLVLCFFEPHGVVFFVCFKYIFK